MSFVDLKYLTSSESREIAQDKSAIALIPVGAFEQHGPHLPLFTDSILVEVMAAKVSDCFQEPIIVTPTLIAGLSEHHVDFPGTITLDPVTLAAEIRAYITALKHMGVTRICLLSFHGGNFSFLGEYAKKCGDDFPEIQIEAYDDFERFLNIMYQAGLSTGLELAPTDSHAGAIETSLVLHVLGEHRVRSFEAVAGYTTGEPGWMEIMQENGVPAISPSGVFGNPVGANPEAGEVILNALVEEVAFWLEGIYKLEKISEI
ncbi:creatininase family protein [Alkalihalobacterium alkalinitrilicum]|uniref:creatininase family protein n=1 Tax=Alkalihalobacterium alkalinitrilicum TaxID=427920 RepID=UPI0009948F1A|nr:creatininase family protein [Alkalihalobacterium alkalinitrilicum]